MYDEEHQHASYADRDRHFTTSRCHGQMFSVKSKSCFHGSLRSEVKHAPQVYGELHYRQYRKAWDNRVYQSPCHIFSQPDRQTQAKQHKASSKARGGLQHHQSQQPWAVCRPHTEALEEEIVVANLLQDSSDCWSPLGWLQEGPRHAFRAKSALPAWHKKRPRTAAAGSRKADAPCHGLVAITAASSAARGDPRAQLIPHSSDILLHPSAPSAGALAACDASACSVLEQGMSASADNSQPLDDSSPRSAAPDRPSTSACSVLMQDESAHAGSIQPSDGSPNSSTAARRPCSSVHIADLLQQSHGVPSQDTAAAMAAWLVQQPDLLQSVLTQLEALAMEPSSQEPSPAEYSQRSGHSAVITGDQEAASASAAAVQPLHRLSHSPGGDVDLASLADTSEALQGATSANAHTPPAASTFTQPESTDPVSSCGAASGQATAAGVSKAAAAAVEEQADTASPQALLIEQADARAQPPYLSQLLLEYSMAGRYDEARTLLKRDILVDCVDTEGNTPLMLSCREGHGRLVKLFLRKGADVSIRSSAGLDAKQLASNMGHTHIAQFLQEI